MKSNLFREDFVAGCINIWFHMYFIFLGNGNQMHYKNIIQCKETEVYKDIFQIYKTFWGTILSGICAFQGWLAFFQRLSFFVCENRSAGGLL